MRCRSAVLTRVPGSLMAREMIEISVVDRFIDNFWCWHHFVIGMFFGDFLKVLVETVLIVNLFFFLAWTVGTILVLLFASIRLLSTVEFHLVVKARPVPYCTCTVGRHDICHLHVSCVFLFNNRIIDAHYRFSFFLLRGVRKLQFVLVSSVLFSGFGRLWLALLCD